MKDIEQIKEIFLDESLDEETKTENLKQIQEWEKSLVKNENFIRWQEHEITKQIFQQAKEAYKDNALSLLRRDLTENQRQAIYAKMDANLWIISLFGRDDAKLNIDQINKEIRQALNATK